MRAIRFSPARFVSVCLLSACSIAALALTAAQARAAGAQAAASVSPHTDALQLVFALAADKIRALDGDTPWLDTQERAWSVRRPVAPGVIDSTHGFEVNYAIDGRVVATWSVDTRKQTVTESPPRAKPKSSP